MSIDFDEATLANLARNQYERGEADFTIDETATALILIDMQEEFLTPAGGPYQVPEAARRIPAMKQLLETFRQRKRPVIHTAFAATHQGLDRPAAGGCMPNRAREVRFDDAHLFKEARFTPELRPLPSEVVVLKPSYGAFYDTPLETMLKRLGIQTVVLAGTLTDCCVGTTARQAYERGYQVIVASDATATSLPKFHNAELSILRRAFARVRTVDQILEDLWPPTAQGQR